MIRRPPVFTFTLLTCLYIVACSKGKDDSEKKTEPNKKSLAIDVIASDLEFPWGLAFLPGGDLLFTERPGRLGLLSKGGKQIKTIAARDVQQFSEGGLLGVTVDPDHINNHFIYLYETATESNQVVRFTLEDGSLANEKVIIRGIPKNGNHNGGVLQFGPDGYLYIGTGDAQLPSSSQDIESLAGKILRVDREGAPAPGNPFNNMIWSYGHRNVQGLAWDDQGKMYATEHGPSGDLGWCCHDEVNLVEKGGNYGWPLALGGTEKDSLRQPVSHSGNDTWAPSGCAVTGERALWPGTLAVACLRGQKIIRFRLDSDGRSVTGRSDTLEGTFGRIRNIVEAPDGDIIFCTSNGDDQIARIPAW